MKNLLSLFNFWPDAVTEVKTDIYVTSFGPVSDTDMVSLVPAQVKVTQNPNPRKSSTVFFRRCHIQSNELCYLLLVCCLARGLFLANIAGYLI